MKLKIPLFAVELTPYSFHIGLIAKIGRKNIRLIVDTGASQTVISSKLVDLLNLKKTVPELNNVTVGIGQGTLNPEFAVLPEFKINSVKISNLPCIILPMDHINTTYKSAGHKSIDGILGNDLLAALKARLDIAELSMQVKIRKNSLDFAEYMKTAFHLKNRT